jgi:hypothetical protein
MTISMKQHHAARCALADLCGALQDYQQRGGDSFHDYEAHRLTIKEFAEAFNLEDEVPEDCK